MYGTCICLLGPSDPTIYNVYGWCVISEAGLYLLLGVKLCVESCFQSFFIIPIIYLYFLIQRISSTHHIVQVIWAYFSK